MSLEAAIQANTEAMHALIAALSEYKSPITVESNVPPVKEKAAFAEKLIEAPAPLSAEEKAALEKKFNVKTNKDIENEKAEAEPETKTTKKAAPSKTETAKSEVQSEDVIPDITYDDVANAAKPLAMVAGRDALIGLLKEFNAPTAKDLKEDQWPAFIRKAKELTAAAETAEV